MRYWQAWMACGLLISLTAAAEADIYRWDKCSRALTRQPIVALYDILTASRKHVQSRFLRVGVWFGDSNWMGNSTAAISVTYFKRPRTKLTSS
jgi:hypothetical protein